MKIARTILRSRCTVAVFAGLILASAFPNIGVAGFAWVAPALMLAAGFGAKGKHAFWTGYLAAFTHYLASLTWLLEIPYRWMSIPVGPALGWIALSAFLSIFPATWVWGMWRMQSRNASSTSPWWGFAAEIQTWTWGRRIGWPILAAAAWVAFEMIIARIFGGFPWNLLAASQFEILPVIQFASITGVYGISFLIAWTSIALLCAAALLVRQPVRRSAWIGAVALPLCAVLAAFLHGNRALSQPPVSSDSIRLALIQPSIPQTLIWNPNNNDERFRELIRLSEDALAEPTDVLVWPEAAIPGLLRYEQEILDAVSSLARRHQVWMIVGADDAEPRRGSGNSREAEYFNSSFLISPDGTLINRYRKRSLVMFGEYIPLERWLPFIKTLMPWMPGSFTPGDRAVSFEFSPRAPDNADAGLRVSTSVLICFEDNFPHLVTEYAQDDTDFLLNLTNNGWFGESAAQWQHAANAVFRAIENGLPLVRCTNNGLTCWVDAQGRLRQVFRDANGRVYGKGFLHATVPVGNPTGRVQTFYNRHGDLLGWVCVAASGAALSLRLMSWRLNRFRRATGLER